MIDLDRIEPDPDQPRKEMDQSELKNLAMSIRDLKLQQPVITYRDGSRFRLVDGHRRCESCRMLKLEEIAAIVLDSKPDSDYFAVAAARYNTVKIIL